MCHPDSALVSVSLQTVCSLTDHRSRLNSVMQIGINGTQSQVSFHCKTLLKLDYTWVILFQIIQISETSLAKILGFVNVYYLITHEATLRSQYLWN